MCYLSLPRGAVGRSAVCDRGIFWPYSLSYWYQCLALSMLVSIRILVSKTPVMHFLNANTDTQS